MSAFNNSTYLTESVRALNILYVYDRSYEPFLAMWLFPLQLVFREEEQAKDIGECAVGHMRSAHGSFRHDTFSQADGKLAFLTHRG